MTPRLDLDPISPALTIPNQGPSRPGAVKNEKGEGRGQDRGGGGRGAGGDLATGAGAGMGLGLGAGIAGEGAAPERD